MRWACLVVLVACSIPELDGSDKECPCARGFVCDEARNRCVEVLDAAVDGSSDATTDATTDATDAGDGGADATADVGLDAPTDAPMDVVADTLDGGVDAGPSLCPGGAVYCVDFDEDLTPYTVVGDGFAMTAGIDENAGRFFGAPNYVEIDRPVAGSFHVRLWLRPGGIGFLSPTPIVELAWGPDADQRIALFLLNSGGERSYFFGIEDSDGVFTTVPDTGDWSCIQLSVAPSRVGIRVDGRPEDRGAIMLSEEFRPLNFGLIETTSGIGDRLFLDEIAIGPMPIACDDF